MYILHIYIFTSFSISYTSFSLYISIFILHLLFGALLLCKNLGYLLIAFRNSSIAEFYIIKLYTFIIYIYFFLFSQPIFRIKIRTSFLYSLALSLSLSLTTAMVLAVSFLSISCYPPFFLKFFFILHQHLTFYKYFFNFFIFRKLKRKQARYMYIYLA